MSESTKLRWRSAALDGFAVLVGILLAFAIDAWWDLRRQDAQAQAYLAALETELQENREIIVRDLEELEDWIWDSRKYLEEVVSPQAKPTYEQVREMVWRTGPNQTRPLLRAAVDDLTSSGGLQAITSAELRRAIARYVRTLDRDATELEDVRSVFRTYQLQYHIEYGSFTEFDWEAYAEVDESAVSFELDVDAFVGNREYANLLISRILNFGNLRDTHREVHGQIDKVLRLIADAMED